MATLRMNRREMLRLAVNGVGVVALHGCAGRAAKTAQLTIRRTTKRPNIILIVADDLGYSDLGCYGAETATPNIDRLAAEGMRFTHFYNCARCCPSRASLLTGLYPHQAGIGYMTDQEFDFGKRGYRGHLSTNAVTFGEVLGLAGYHTFMVGKWHVGREDSSMWPVERGFNEYYGILHGASSYFKVSPDAMLVRNWTPVRQKGDAYYTTDAFTDYAVKFIDEHARRHRNPYFLYVAYTAPHWPLHAWPEDIAKYRGKYMIGWDELRRRRLERQKELGIVREDCGLTPRDPEIKPWDTVDSKENWDLRMAVYAAMVDRMDQSIGRILEAERRKGDEQNTLVIFLSDNAACPEPIELAPGVAPGPVESFSGYYAPWANASNTPFREYKHWVHEGGIITPFIVKWPAVVKEVGGVTAQVGHVIDLMATFLDVAGATYPETYRGNDILPLEGKSLLPVFEGRERAGHEALFWEHEGNRAVRKGNWKLVSEYSNYGMYLSEHLVTTYSNAWELYDLESDPTEMVNLVSRYPKRVQEMAAMYDRWAKRCFVEPWGEMILPVARQKEPQERREVFRVMSERFKTMMENRQEN